MKLTWLPLILLLSACLDKRPLYYSNSNYVQKKVKSSRSVDIDFICQQEAKLSDIPIPLNAHPIPKYFNKNDKEHISIVMGYGTPLSPQEITLFYSLEMERLGWKQVALFESTETLLSFEKPGHICIISIRPCVQKNRKGGKLVIFTGLKDITHM